MPREDLLKLVRLLLREQLELRYLNRTEEYIGLVECQSRMFRNGEAQAGRDLDAKISEVKAARAEALKELNEHTKEHGY